MIRRQLLLDRLRDSGNSVIASEHHRAGRAHADWIIEPPGAGHDGGGIVSAATIIRQAQPGRTG